MIWKFPKYEINQPIDWDEIELSYDWFRDMKGVPQDEEWHAEGDVFIHTKMVVEALLALDEFKALDEQNKHILFTSALLHDVEKRSTTTTEEIDGRTRVVSPRHAKKGRIHNSKNFIYGSSHSISYQRTNRKACSTPWITFVGNTKV